MLTAGCRTTGEGIVPEYIGSRVADFNDIFVYSAGVGLGLNSHIRLTKYCQAGVGFGSWSRNAGYLNRSVGWAIYHESDVSAAFLNAVVTLFTARSGNSTKMWYWWPTNYARQLYFEGQSGQYWHDAYYASDRDMNREKYVSRLFDRLFSRFKTKDCYHEASLFFFYPIEEFAHENESILRTDTRQPAVMDAAGMRWPDRFSFEFKIMPVFYNLRIGFNPVEAVDFALGFLTIDLCGDDKNGHNVIGFKHQRPYGDTVVAPEQVAPLDKAPATTGRPVEIEIEAIDDRPRPAENDTPPAETETDEVEVEVEEIEIDPDVE